MMEAQQPNFWQSRKEVKNWKSRKEQTDEQPAMLFGAQNNKNSL